MTNWTPFEKIEPDEAQHKAMEALAITVKINSEFIHHTKAFDEANQDFNTLNENQTPTKTEQTQIRKAKKEAKEEYEKLLGCYDKLRQEQKHLNKADERPDGSKYGVKSTVKAFTITTRVDMIALGTHIEQHIKVQEIKQHNKILVLIGLYLEKIISSKKTILIQEIEKESMKKMTFREIIAALCNIISPTKIPPTYECIFEAISKGRRKNEPTYELFGRLWSSYEQANHFLRGKGEIENDKNVILTACYTYMSPLHRHTYDSAVKKHEIEKTPIDHQALLLDRAAGH